MRKAMLFMVLMSISAFAQSAPLNVKGSFKCKSEPVKSSRGEDGIRVIGTGPIVVQNATQRKIVAVVLKAESFCGSVDNRMIYSHDMIFKAHAVMPGDQLEIPLDIDQSISAVSGITRGTFKVEPIFVQFEDGSTWGDESFARDFAKDRATVVNWLVELQSMGSDEEFSKAIDKASPTPETDMVDVRKSLQLVREQSGIASVRSVIADRLKTYDERISNGRF